MKKVGWIAWILCLVTLLSGCSGILERAMQNARDKVEAVEQPDTDVIAFAELEYVRPEMEKLQGLVDDCRQSAKDGKNYLELNVDLNKFYDFIYEFGTMMNLANIRYAQNLTDAYYKGEYEYCVSQTSKVESMMEELFVALAQSGHVDKLEENVFGEGFFDAYMAPEGSGDDWEYESVWDEGYTALYEREAELSNEYYAKQEDLSDLTFESDGDFEQALEILGPLLVELIQVRQEMAAYLGYDSYEQMAGQWYYNRLYTTQQTERYVNDIQKYLVPVYTEANGAALWDELYELKSTPEMSLEYVESASKAMGGDIRRACNLLTERELYDNAPGPNKAAGAFEVYLTSFEVPFIFQNPTGYMEDILGFTHEFGHFVNDYAAGGTSASADVCEVFSQAMEYLSLCYADSLDDQTMEWLENYAMLNSLSTYVEQAAYYSFEQQAYRLTGEELSVEALGNLYRQIGEAYGFDSTNWDWREWVLVPHFYQQPFYVFSYVASNDGAMQLYQMELETPGAGLELYSQMISDWEDIPLGDYLSGYDLLDPLADGRVEELAALFRGELADILP